MSVKKGEIMEQKVVQKWEVVEKRKKCTSRVLGASECNFRVDRIGWFENQVSSNNYEILEWSKYRKWMIGGVSAVWDGVSNVLQFNYDTYYHSAGIGHGFGHAKYWINVLKLSCITHRLADYSLLNTGVIQPFVEYRDPWSTSNGAPAYGDCYQSLYHEFLQ